MNKQKNEQLTALQKRIEEKAFTQARREWLEFARTIADWTTRNENFVGARLDIDGESQFRNYHGPATIGRELAQALNAYAETWRAARTAALVDSNVNDLLEKVTVTI